MSLAANSLINTKPIIERAHYPPIQHRHGHSSKGGGKHSIAISALTLLSFLFFLNILQNCLDEHMEAMNSTQQVIVIQSRSPEIRELEAQKRKGETDDNLTSPEARIGVDKTDRYTQIPVKLRTNEKAAIKP